MYLLYSHIWGLRVWVGFEASWRGEPLFLSSSWRAEPLFLSSSFMFGRTHSSCSEGHFVSIVFGRTNCLMFGRTLFRIWQIKLFKQNLSYFFKKGLSISALLNEIHRYTLLSNWFRGRGDRKRDENVKGVTLGGRRVRKETLYSVRKDTFQNMINKTF